MLVVLFIAITASVVTTRFVFTRLRARSKQAQSNIRNALTTEKTYYVDNQAYTATVASLSEIGRASCRERVEISVGAVTLKKKKVSTNDSDRLVLERDRNSAQKLIQANIT